MLASEDPYSILIVDHYIYYTTKTSLYRIDTVTRVEEELDGISCITSDLIAERSGNVLYKGLRLAGALEGNLYLYYNLEESFFILSFDISKQQIKVIAEVHNIEAMKVVVDKGDFYFSGRFGGVYKYLSEGQTLFPVSEEMVEDIALGQGGVLYITIDGALRKYSKGMAETLSSGHAGRRLSVQNDTVYFLSGDTIRGISLVGSPPENQIVVGNGASSFTVTETGIFVLYLNGSLKYIEFETK